MQFPGGGLANRFGEFRIVVAGGVAAAIAALAVAVAPSFVLIIVAAGAIGLSTGGHKTVAIKYLSRLCSMAGMAILLMVESLSASSRRRCFSDSVFTGLGRSAMPTSRR
jgi:MFS family permease